MKPRVAFDSANAFDKPIDFDIEVAEDDEVRFIGIGREAIGGDGKASQYTLNFIQESIDLRFNWMETDIYQQVIFWMENFAIQGDTFRYYPDQTDLTRYFECKMSGENKTFNPVRAHPRVVEFDVKFVARIILVSAAILADRAGYYP